MPSRNEPCPIYLQPLGVFNGYPQATAMGHQPSPGLWLAFHLGCLAKWQQTNNTCPLCRKYANP